MTTVFELRKIRRKQKKTLREVAGLAPVSVPYLSEVERGLRVPSIEIVERVLAAYGKKLVIVSDTLPLGVFERLRVLLDDYSA